MLAPGRVLRSLGALTCVAVAHAREPSSAPPEQGELWRPSAHVPRSAKADTPAGVEAPSLPLPPLGASYRLLAGLGFGRGIRFENPYRLQTELGHNAESLSLTATYLDAQLGGVLGARGALFHGVVIHGSFALPGIAHEVCTPSYLLLVRPDGRWGILGRAGIPIVIEPDANAGFEVSGGGVLYLTAGIGITASLVGSLFFGAATLDSSRPAIPILSLELGALYDYEA